MTIEDAELEGGKQTIRTHRQWAAHVDAVTAAVTTAKVRKTYRNHLVRFVLFLHNMTCTSSEVDDRSIGGENSNEESEEEGIRKEDFDILHGRRRPLLKQCPSPKLRGERRQGRKNWLNWRRKGMSRRPSSENSKRLLMDLSCIVALVF